MDLADQSTCRFQSKNNRSTKNSRPYFLLIFGLHTPFERCNRPMVAPHSSSISKRICLHCGMRSCPQQMRILSPCTRSIKPRSTGSPNNAIGTSGLLAKPHPHLPIRPLISGAKRRWRERDGNLNVTPNFLRQRMVSSPDAPFWTL